MTTTIDGNPQNATYQASPEQFSVSAVNSDDDFMNALSRSHTVAAVFDSLAISYDGDAILPHIPTFDFGLTVWLASRPTVCVTCVWTAVDSVWEQEKLEANKIF